MARVTFNSTMSAASLCANRAGFSLPERLTETPDGVGGHRSRPGVWQVRSTRKIKGWGCRCQLTHRSLRVVHLTVRVEIFVQCEIYAGSSHGRWRYLHFPTWRTPVPFLSIYIVGKRRRRATVGAARVDLRSTRAASPPRRPLRTSRLLCRSRKFPGRNCA